MRYRYLLCWVSVLYMTLVGTSVGQPKPTPEDRFNQAVELAKTGDYEEAVEICREVIERLPASEHSRVHKLLGYAYKKLDMFPNAWHYLTRYLESSGKEDTTAGGWLQEVEATLKQTHVKVAFSCQPEDVVLYIPASKPGVASQSALHNPQSQIAWWFKPGKHTVKATAPGHKPRSMDIDVRERGDSGMREIILATVEPDKISGVGGLGPDHTGTTIAKPAELKKHSRAFEWALIGSGLALGVTGGIFQAIGYAKNETLHSKYLDSTDYPMAVDAKSDYDKAYKEQVRPSEIASYVLYGVGGAAVVAGVVAGVVTWFVRKPGGAGSKTSTFSVSPFSLPGGTGALMTLEF